MAEGIAAFVVALMTAALKIVRGRRDNRPDHLTVLAKLYRMLPEDSKSRDLLLEHIDVGLKEMVEVESQNTRDALGVGIAIGLVAVGILLSWAALRGRWWWALLLPGSVSLLLGFAGFAISFPKRRRDAKGKVID